MSTAIRTITKRDVQCVKCGDWLEEWEIHPETDMWVFCIPCGEKFFHEGRDMKSLVFDGATPIVPCQESSTGFALVVNASPVNEPRRRLTAAVPVDPNSYDDVTRATLEAMEKTEASISAWAELQGAPSYCERWNRVKRGLAAVCEACGEVFEIKDGYYEAVHEPTYAYCRDCCHW